MGFSNRTSETPAKSEILVVRAFFENRKRRLPEHRRLPSMIVVADALAVALYI
jgi:hypothetical protein